MNEKDKLQASAADPHQDKDNEREDDASTRYDAYWLAFHDWCVARGIPEDEMRESDYQVQFERDYYGD
jgi:hypothetical protein